MPGHLEDDNVLPSFSDIPNIITSIRHPRRRAVSVGPQSEADAYETLAYREQRRRDSTLDSSRTSGAFAHANLMEPCSHSAFVGRRPLMPGRAVPQVEKYEHMMGTGSPEPSSPDPSRRKDAPGDEMTGASEEDMFARINKPRVRYDVEVVTKLIVYSGAFSESRFGFHSSWLTAPGQVLLFSSSTLCRLCMNALALRRDAVARRSIGRHTT